MIVPSEFHGLLIGRKGEHKQRLENETGTSLIIPKAGSTVSLVSINGNALLCLASTVLMS